jgi:hypothetical protein
MNISCVLGQGVSLLSSFLASYICSKNGNCGYNYNFSNVGNESDHGFFIRHPMQWQFLIFSIMGVFPLIFCLFINVNNPKVGNNEMDDKPKKLNNYCGLYYELTHFKFFGVVFYLFPFFFFFFFFIS